MIKEHLLAPGPTPVPPRVLLAMARPIMHHRTPQFARIFAAVRAGLRELFRTAQDVLVLGSSGTGAMEAAVSNCFSPGDEVLVVNAGKFGDRWLKLCRAFELKPFELKVERGRAVRPEQVEEALTRNPGARAVLVQACETSTTAVHPIDRLGPLARRSDALLVVDGITAVGVYDVPMDRWGIDVLLTGSQKALMLPPGLACIALSERAWARCVASRQRRFYFDLQRERENQAKDTTAWTPAISHVYALREALEMIREEGLENVFVRHSRLAAAVRAAVAALGLRLVAPDCPGPGATGVYVPDGVDGAKLVSYLRDRMRVTFAGGQDELKGRIVRIAHLGYMGTFDVIAAIAALEMALSRSGHELKLGDGVRAAEELLMAGLPAWG